MTIPSSHLLELLGSASLRASFVSLVLLALRPWLRRAFGSAWVSLLWLLVLVRLLVPWSAESSWSPFRHELKSTVLSSVPSPWKVHVAVRDVTQPTVATSAAVSDFSRRPWGSSWLLGSMWAVGFLTTLGYFGIRSWRTRGVLRRARSIADARLERVYETLPQSLQTRVALRVTEEISVAALVGIWRPHILVPREWLAKLNDEELRHVLLHELGHARRGDLIVQWLFALAQCLHWFNPLVWLAARGARIDAELACDAWVLARGSEAEREGYGETLLKTSQLFRRHLAMSPAAIGMAASRETLVARVRQVSAFRSVTPLRRVLSLTLLVVAAALLMTHRIAAEAPVEATPSIPAEPKAEPVPPSAVKEEAKPSAEATASFPAVAPPARPVAEAKPKPAEVDKRQIEIEGKFFEVSEDTAKKLGLVSMPMDSDPRAGNAKKKAKNAVPLIAVNSVLREEEVNALLLKLNKTKGLDLLSAPRVTTKTGQRAVIEIIREFRYPTEYDWDKARGIMTPKAFETRNLGVTLEVEPLAVADGVIDLAVVPQIVELEGFMKAKDSRPVPLRSGRSVGANMNIKDFAGVTYPKDDVLQPIFSERKISTNVELRSGTSMLLGGLRRDTPQEGKPPLSFYLYILVTARVIDHPGIPADPAPSSLPEAGASDFSRQAPQAPANAVVGNNDGVPLAVPVSEKPGFVTSPFAPKAGYVDVRGFPSGTMIKCPYSGETFKLP